TSGPPPSRLPAPAATLLARRPHFSSLLTRRPFLAPLCPDMCHALVSNVGNHPEPSAPSRPRVDYALIARPVCLIDHMHSSASNMITEIRITTETLCLHNTFCFRQDYSFRDLSGRGRARGPISCPLGCRAFRP